MEVSYRYRSSKPSRRNPIRFAKMRFNIKKVLTAFAIIAGVGIFFAVGAFAWISRDLPNPNKLLSRAVPLSTKIYDRTGTNLLYDIHKNEQRSLITIKDVPNHLKWATITAEDRNFYTHSGFDLKGIARAIYKNVIRREKVQGGSTITQQFVKNALLTTKKTFTRKTKELILSYQIERNFSKDEILQLYFNEIPYGSTAYGAQSAARIYFDKDVRQLTLAEAAILAALPKAPTYYSPWGNNRDKLIARQHQILSNMAELGYISKEESEGARSEKISFKKPGQAITAPHFVMHIKELLTEMYGESMVEEGGLKVITSLDFEKQKIAEEALRKGAERNLSYNASNAALVSLDAYSGEILSMVGSKDYFDESIDGNVNVVLRKRQPGSSFKPIVYAAAFEKGYTPQTMLFDVVTNFDTTGTKEYTPHNYNGKEYGPVTMKQALAGSLNIAAVKTLYLTGVRRVIDFAQRLNYTSLQDPDRYGLALVLGGGEVTLLEHAAAFGAFAREGDLSKPTALLRVEDKNGTVLFENKNNSTHSVIDKEVARQINDVLSDNGARAYVFGERNHLTLGSRPVAAKTGTTNDYRDAWTIGYTPSVITGVWVGNNNNTPMKRGADGSQLAAPIWNEYMKRILEKTEIESFTKPAPIQVEKDVLNGKVGQETKVKINKLSGRLATNRTPVENIEEKIFRTVHTILYYIDKENPRGEAPQYPEQDPQFSEWEKKVRGWVEKNKIEEGVPPTEEDTLNTIENTPSLTILSPQNNETITQNTLRTNIQTSAPRGVQKVEYFLDDVLLETVTTPPFNLEYPLSGVENGFHTLTVKSFDDVGNTISASLTLNFLLQKRLPYIEWLSPQQGQKISSNSGIDVSVAIRMPDGVRPEDARKLSLLTTSKSTGITTLIGTITSPSKIVSILWNTPDPGPYNLSAQLFDRYNTLVSQKKILISVE